jgi:peptidoglycan/xylan/chitin deacetylase (PgdA/CDA1 family)
MSGIWPGDTQCVANLTFDVDGVSGWLNRDPEFAKRANIMSMAEYGPSVAAWRILDLLDGHGIKASFYIPGYVAETHNDLVREIARRGHEAGHHGYMHEPPNSLTPDGEREVLEKGISILEGLVGQKPRGYRAPVFELSEVTLDLVASQGFTYDSSMMGDDAPYVVDTANGKLVEIPVCFALDDFPHVVFSPAAGRTSPQKSPDELYEIWASEFEGLYRYGRSFTLVMHPQVIGRPGRLLMLDRLINHIRSFPNVAFMRMIDVAEMWAGR